VPSPIILRRTYLYLKLHASSNKAANRIDITSNDFFSHVAPSYSKKNNYDKLYKVKECLVFLDTVNSFFLALKHKLPFSLKNLLPAVFREKLPNPIGVSALRISIYKLYKWQGRY